MQLLPRTKTALAAEREAPLILARGLRNAMNDQMMLSLTDIRFAFQARGLFSAGVAAERLVAMRAKALHQRLKLLQEDAGCRQGLLVMRSPGLHYRSMIQQFAKSGDMFLRCPALLKSAMLSCRGKTGTLRQLNS